MKTEKVDKRKICFFCSKEIIGKKSLEHIIPNSLLGKLGIKEEIVDTLGNGNFQYSRVKVPAHVTCNSTFGSEYEQRIMDYLDNPTNLYKEILNEEKGIMLRYGPDESVTLLFSTWLSKIYYGLFYNDYLKIKDSKYNQLAEEIIKSKNFDLIRNAYKNGNGFCLPSSLYVFKTNESNFDLQTLAHPQTIMIKIQKLVFILCIGDGYLVKNYLNGGILQEVREYLELEERKNKRFPSQLFALAEVVALRMNIPKSPSFIVSENEIINMSLSTMVGNPGEKYKVDNDKVFETKTQILEELQRIK